jgi:hypothetical protein
MTTGADYSITAARFDPRAAAQLRLNGNSLQMNWLGWIALLVVVAGIIAVAAVLVRAYMTGSGPGASLFNNGRERRLDVVEYASVDSRRKLILVRRDDVEHLIMTGGPIDVVVETGIGAQKLHERPRLAALEGDKPLFGTRAVPQRTAPTLQSQKVEG